MTLTFCAKVIKAKGTFLLFRICCQCEYGVKALFNVFALLVSSKGVYLGINQSDGSISNFSQSESRIWPT